MPGEVVLYASSARGQIAMDWDPVQFLFARKFRRQTKLVHNHPRNLRSSVLRTVDFQHAWQRPTRPTAITVGDVNYPANIMSMWTASELEAIGIYEVVDDSTNRKDGNWYINGAESFNFVMMFFTKIIL